MGRPPIELDEARRRRLLSALEVGATLKMAAAAAGVSEATLGRWRKARPDLEQEIEHAEAAGSVRALEAVHAAAAAGTWQAAAWLLERRYPGEYGRRTPRMNEAPDVPRSSLDDSLERYRRLAERVATELHDAETEVRLARLMGDILNERDSRPDGMVYLPVEEAGPLIILPEKENRELPENPTTADVRAAQARANERRNQGDGLAFS